MTGDMRIDSRLDSAGIISEAARTSQELGGKTGRPKGVVMIHFNILKNVHHFNYWKPYREGGVYLHAAAIFASLIFLQCSPRRPSARVRSRCRVSPLHTSAPRSRRRGPTTRF